MLLLLARRRGFELLLQGGFASLVGRLEALALRLRVSSKIVILLQGGFASFVGRLDLLSRDPNDRHSFPPPSIPY